LLIASLSFVNATNVEPNTKKQDEPVKKEKVQRIDPARICRYYAIMEANNYADYGSTWWQAIYLDEYRDCMNEIQ